MSRFPVDFWTIKRHFFATECNGCNLPSYRQGFQPEEIHTPLQSGEMFLVGASHSVEADSMQSASKLSGPHRDQGHFTQSMIEMIEIIEHAIDIEMGRNASPTHLANASVIALCRVLGGTSVYLPRAAALKKKIRNAGIFKDFRAGMSAREISKKYKICSQAIYDIIGQERSSSLLSTLSSFRAKGTRKPAGTELLLKSRPRPTALPMVGSGSSPHFGNG